MHIKLIREYSAVTIDILHSEVVGVIISMVFAGTDPAIEVILSKTCPLHCASLCNF